MTRPHCRAVRDADAREEQAQVVVDLGHRADGRARVARGRLLVDGDRRGQALDVVDVRLLHLAEELPRVGRQRLDVAALALRVDGVERERALAGAGQAGDDDQLVARDVEVDAAQVVLAGAADGDEVEGHVRILSGPVDPWRLGARCLRPNLDCTPGPQARRRWTVRDAADRRENEAPRLRRKRPERSVGATCELSASALRAAATIDDRSSCRRRPCRP